MERFWKLIRNLFSTLRHGSSRVETELRSDSVIGSRCFGERGAVDTFAMIHSEQEHVQARAPPHRTRRKTRSYITTADVRKSLEWRPALPRMSHCSQSLWGVCLSLVISLSAACLPPISSKTRGVTDA